MQTKADIVQESLDRVQKIKKGDPVTNICAGKENPMRLSYFVGIVIKQRKNKYGLVMTDRWAKCTDRNGNTWNSGIEVIYPGHIEYAKSCEMFEPIHAVLFP